MPKELFDLKNTEAMDGNSYLNEKLHQAYHHYIKVNTGPYYPSLQQILALTLPYYDSGNYRNFTYIDLPCLSVLLLQSFFCQPFFHLKFLVQCPHVYTHILTSSVLIHRWCPPVCSPPPPGILSSLTRWSSHLKL